MVQEVLAAPDRPLAQQPGYLERLGAFTGAARVKRLALKLMVAAAATTGAVNSKQLVRLREMFQEMDTDGDGIITGQQLAAGLGQLGTQLSEQDLAEFLQVSKVGAARHGLRHHWGARVRGGQRHSAVQGERAFSNRCVSCFGVPAAQLNSICGGALAPHLCWHNW